jgi:hypothetical protein
MRKPARRTKARKVASRLSCRTINLRNPLSATRRTAPRGFEPSDRPSDAGTPAFPLGFPSPAADSSECPPESPAAATPPESPSHHPPHPHIPSSAASAPPLPPQAPRASSSRRRSCAFPGPTTTLKGSPSSFTQTRALVPFRLLCPSIPTPSPGVSQNRRTTARSCPTTRRGPTKLGHTPFPPFFASTRVESIATASTFTFPSVSPQSRRAGRIWCQTPFSWSS